MIAFRNFYRHLRDGFRNLFRNGWITAASIFTMTATLFMIGGLVLLLLNIDNVTQDIEEGVKIRVHIDLVATPEEEAELQSNIEALPQVTDVTYRSKDEELDYLIETVGEEFELFDEDTNPLFNVLVVTVADPADLNPVSEEIQSMPRAVEVNYGQIDAENLLKSLDMVRIGVALIASILIVIAIALISNTIKLTIYARQEEIEIMRLVGAQNRYIKAPFAYEGGFIGLLSAGMAILFLYAAYQGLQDSAFELTGVRFIQFAPTWPTLIYIGIGLVLIGILLGVLGARRPIKKFLQI